MIKRFGPTQYDVVMFPPDKDPWPAYTIWDFFPAIFNCPHEVERIGHMGDGGRWICGVSRVEDKPDCIIYSFGFTWETSFEQEILEHTSGCQIWGYDWTVKSLGGIPRSQRHRTHFQPYELAPSDAHEPDDSPKKYTLDTLMKINGHTYIDILKVDAEGGEFATFSKLVRSYIAADRPLPFGQLILEIHLWGKKFSEVLAFWELLEAAGLRPFRNEPNLVYQNYNKQSNTELAEYSFLNIRGQNVFIADPTPPTMVIDPEPNP